MMPSRVWAEGGGEGASSWNTPSPALECLSPATARDPCKSGMRDPVPQWTGQVVYLGANCPITSLLQNSCQRTKWSHFLHNTLIFWDICPQTRGDLNPQSPDLNRIYTTYIYYIYILNRIYDHKVTKYLWASSSKKRNKYTFSLRSLVFSGLPWNFITGIVWHSYFV